MVLNLTSSLSYNPLQYTKTTVILATQRLYNNITVLLILKSPLIDFQYYQ